MPFRAVIFDLGGVVIDSPLHAIAAFERECGLPAGFVNRVVVGGGPEGAWSRLERGQVGMAEFQRLFEAECAAAGHPLSALALMERIAACGPRPSMLRAIGRLRESGLRVAALTNNWSHAGDGSASLEGHFDVFVESSRLGMRKPDPRIYHHTLAALDVPAPEAVFLDDIGSNLKAARALGLHTIKVEDPQRALGELAQLLRLALD